MRRFILFCFVLLMLVAVSAAAGWYWLTGIYAVSAAPFAEETTVEIPPGTSGKRIGKLLQESGVITHADAFRLLAVLEDKNHRFQAGEYLFTPGITPLGVMEKLARGEVVRHQVTVPEGKTSAEIAQILMAAESLKGVLAQLPAEGSLLPETYDFTRNTERAKLVARMADAQQSLLDSLWPNRQPELPFSTMHEAVTLASIIEKETGLPQERRRIAGVYVNRLKIGMPLQADPTVAYGVYGGQYADKPLTRADLKKDTPYNTYLHAGLPPGPICHPGKAAIEAVLNPLETKEIYFVARGDGGHYFSETIAQHNENVRRYRKWKAGERVNGPTGDRGGNR